MAQAHYNLQVGRGCGVRFTGVCGQATLSRAWVVVGRVELHACMVAQARYSLQVGRGRAVWGYCTRASHPGLLPEGAQGHNGETIRR